MELLWNVFDYPRGVSGGTVRELHTDPVFCGAIDSTAVFERICFRHHTQVCTCVWKSFHRPAVQSSNEPLPWLANKAYTTATDSANDANDATAVFSHGLRETQERRANDDVLFALLDHVKPIMHFFDSFAKEKSRSTAPNVVVYRPLASLTCAACLVSVL